MAAPSVSADVTRIAEATITPDTGTWGNDGGGGGVSDEPDNVYQGTTSQSRKVSTSLIGRSYTHGSGTDMDGTPANQAHVIMKLNITNFGALNTRTTPGSELKIGSGSGDYHSYYLFGNDNYPPLGGWQILAIAPSVSGYASAVGDTGTPNDSSILYWSWLADFTATSKSENLIIDAIDIGLGLFLVGGDGVSTDAVFQDFVDFDEGTVNNRYGFVTTRQGVIYAIGQLTIGQTSAGTSTHTDFTDSGVTVVWENGLVTTGFHRLLLDLATSGTVIDVSFCSFSSVGKENNDGDRGYTTTEDSRPVFEVTGTTGAATFTSCVFQNWAGFELTTGMTMDSCVITGCGQVDANGAAVNDCGISAYTGAANTSALLWNVATNPATALQGNTFTANTGTLSHAIEFGLTSPTVIDLNDVNFVGYSASNNVNDSAIHIKRTTGTVTINVSGGSGTVSYRTDGATVNVVNTVSVIVNVIDANTGSAVQDARVLVEAGTVGPLPSDDSVTITSSGTTASVSHTAHGMSAGQLVAIRGVQDTQSVYNGIFAITNVTTNAYDYTLPSSTTSPAVGTITATAVIISELTTAGGVADNTGFNYSTTQEIRGVVRRSTTSPLYKTAGIIGEIGSGGFTATISLIPDE